MRKPMKKLTVNDMTPRRNKWMIKYTIDGRRQQYEKQRKMKEIHIRNHFIEKKNQIMRTNDEISDFTNVLKTGPDRPVR